MTRLPQRILRAFLRDDLIEEVLGDLEEQYKLDLKTRSRTRAGINYWIQTLYYLRPFSLRNRFTRSNNIPMLRNYLKTGWRQLLRQKMYSSIKIGGLALGIAASLLIGLYVRDDVSYDKHLAHQNIYRVYNTYRNPDGALDKWVWIQAPWARTAKEEFPEIELVARTNPGELWGAGANQVRRDDRPESTYEEGFTYVDQDILKILQAKMVYGNMEHCLDQPQTMVITRSKAEKYYPGEDPVGKVMVLNNDPNRSYKIGAVIEDWPLASHFRHDFMMTLTGIVFYQGEQDNWGANNYPTYLKVREGTDPDQLASKLNLILKNYVLPYEKQRGNASIESEMLKSGTGLQRVEDIHLRGADIGDPFSHGDIRFVWLFGAVAIFILLIAVVNFVNLSTARSANRAKEVGLRKTVGSARGSIISQFMVESMLFSVFSFAAGLLLAWIVLPYFNQVAAKNLQFPWTEWWLLPGIAAAAFVVGILAGSYPSFYLSAFKPIEVLRGKVSLGSRSSSLRSSLVVFQFTISVVLIIATVAIYRQMDYFLHRDVGFDREQVLLIQGTSSLGGQMQTFKDELMRLPVVRAVAVSNYLPITGGTRNQNTFSKAGEENSNNTVGAQLWRVDHDYVKAMGLRIVQGRDFSKELATDSIGSQSAIINRRMVKELEFENPIGQQIINYGQRWTIVGVIDDFQTMRDANEAIVLVIGNSTGTVSVKLSTKDMPAALVSIDQVWKTFAPHQPIRYSFLDDTFARMYSDVQRTGNIFTSFAVLAIVVACLGLFALSAFMMEQRNKEISIRLVLGASLGSIFNLLTFNFVKLIVLSIVIAVPIGWYMMDAWLTSFTYKAPIGWDVFAAAGIMSMVIALSTISFHAIKAGMARAVEGLRRE